jgi:hypothetical protein
MAGDEGSFRTGPFPHFGQTSGLGSVYFWMRSQRFSQASHWNSYRGMAVQGFTGFKGFV